MSGFIPQRGLALLNTLACVGQASVADLTSLSAAFDDYLFFFENVVPANNSVGLQMQVHSGGTYKTSAYINGAGGVTTYMDLSQATTIANTANAGLCGFVGLYGVNNTCYHLMTGEVAFYNDAGGLTALTPSGLWTGGTGAIDGVKFLPSTGSFNASGNAGTGQIKVYGIQK